MDWTIYCDHAGGGGGGLSCIKFSYCQCGFRVDLTIIKKNQTNPFNRNKPSAEQDSGRGGHLLGKKRKTG